MQRSTQQPAKVPIRGMQITQKGKHALFDDGMKVLPWWTCSPSRGSLRVSRGAPGYAAAVQNTQLVQQTSVASAFAVAC